MLPCQNENNQHNYQIIKKYVYKIKELSDIVNKQIIPLFHE